VFFSSNKADLELLKSTGIKLDPRPLKKQKKNFKFRSVIWMIRATVRMKKRAADWAESRAINDMIQAQLERQRLHGRKRITSGR